jgi:hypothetical protein
MMYIIFPDNLFIFFLVASLLERQMNRGGRGTILITVEIDVGMVAGKPMPCTVVFAQPRSADARHLRF